MNKSRRLVMIGATTSAIAPQLLLSSAQAREQSCEAPTGPDIEGPFFRDAAPERSLLRTGGETQLLDLEGTVLDAITCRPVAGATVNIWHANSAGEYDLGQSLNYHGLTTTSQSGAYRFKTCRPAPYTDGGLDRPAHIHFKVRASGYMPLTTQMYFAGDSRLKNDQFVIENDGWKRVVKPVLIANQHELAKFHVILVPNTR